MVYLNKKRIKLWVKANKGLSKASNANAGQAKTLKSSWDVKSSGELSTDQQSR